MTVLNVPEYAKEYEYVVARMVDGDAWFWGAYHTYEDAKQAAAYFEDGQVVAIEALE